MCDGGTVEYLRDLVCHKEALQVETNRGNEVVIVIVGGGQPTE